MITDKLSTYFDNAASAAAMTSSVINLMPYRGRNEPVNVFFLVTGATATSAQTITLNFQESDTAGGAFATIETVALPKAVGSTPVLAALRIPRRQRKAFSRMTIAIAGGAAQTGLKVWCGVTRDDFAPYSPGQYIDKGEVVG